MTEIHHVINETLDGRAEKRVFTRSPTRVDQLRVVVAFGQPGREVYRRR